jgi:hypothetical protein
MVGEPALRVGRALNVLYALDSGDREAAVAVTLIVDSPLTNESRLRAICRTVAVLATVASIS